ncbi:hypothetical protein KDA00_03445 [Candidatus Saccharibacteria bacterium]|nr:hypothetical protein [Candidatus Saccharibacteria bacterium]
MITANRILDTVSVLGETMPEYHPDAADINESLDHGVASCAVRAYAAGLLLRQEFPNENLYVINFGFAHDHGCDFVGENGVYDKMGHAVVGFWVPEKPRLVVETYTDSKFEVIPENDTHEGFVWMGLTEGYREYLARVGHDDIEVDPEEILSFLNKLSTHA